MYLWALPAAEFDRRWPDADLAALHFRRFDLAGAEFVGVTCAMRPKHVYPASITSRRLISEYVPELPGAVAPDKRDEYRRRYEAVVPVAKEFERLCHCVNLDDLPEDDRDAGLTS